MSDEQGSAGNQTTPQWEQLAIKRTQPPHPDKLSTSHTEGWLKVQHGFAELPRPSLVIPQWVRGSPPRR